MVLLQLVWLVFVASYSGTKASPWLVLLGTANGSAYMAFKAPAHSRGPWQGETHYNGDPPIAQIICTSTQPQACGDTGERIQLSTTGMVTKRSLRRLTRAFDQVALPHADSFHAAGFRRVRQDSRLNAPWYLVKLATSHRQKVLSPSYITLQYWR